MAHPHVQRLSVEQRQRDLVSWEPLGEWVRAKGALLSYSTTLTNGTKFLRLEVRP